MDVPAVHLLLPYNPKHSGLRLSRVPATYWMLLLQESFLCSKRRPMLETSVNSRITRVVFQQLFARPINAETILPVSPIRRITQHIRTTLITVASLLMAPERPSMHIILRHGIPFQLCLAAQEMVCLVDTALWSVFRHLQQCHRTRTECLQCLEVHPDHHPMDLRMFKTVAPTP